MCAPAIFALTSLFVGLAGSAVSYMGQQQMANQQAAYQQQLMNLERQRALQEQQQLLVRNMQEQEAMRLRQSQEKEAASRELNKVAMEARAASSRATVAAGEAGVSGLSVDALLGEINRQELGYFEASRRQDQMRSVYYDQTMKNQNKALEMNLDASSLGYQMNIASINRPIQRPSFAAFAIDAVGQGLGAYQRFFYPDGINRYTGVGG